MANEADAKPWEDFPAAQMAKAWEKAVPQSAQLILNEALRNVARERRIAWAYVMIQVMTLLLVGGSVASFVWLAKYYADHQAPTQGAAIVCTGLVALVGALLGGRAVIKSESKRANGDVSQPEPGHTSEGTRPQSFDS